MYDSLRVICENSNSELLAEEIRIFLLACKATDVHITQRAYWREKRCAELRATFHIPREELKNVAKNVQAFFCNNTYTLECQETSNGMELAINAAISELLCGAKTMSLSIHLPSFGVQIVK